LFHFTSAIVDALAAGIVRDAGRSILPAGRTEGEREAAERNGVRRERYRVEAQLACSYLEGFKGWEGICVPRGIPRAREREREKERIDISREHISIAVHVLPASLLVHARDKSSAIDKSRTDARLLRSLPSHPGGGRGRETGIESRADNDFAHVTASAAGMREIAVIAGFVRRTRPRPPNERRTAGKKSEERRLASKRRYASGKKHLQGAFSVSFNVARN